MPRLPSISLCAVCHGWGRSRLCGECVGRFAAPVQRCGRCALACALPLCGACLRDPPPYAATVAALDYGFPWDRLISRLKFHDGLDLVPALAGLLADAVRRVAAPLPALVVPVPLGARRLRERGYNQAWELARRAARALGCRAEAATLQRLADTPRQLDLPRERRRANVRGCFAVARPADVHGRDVALVDDVMTTDATAREAAATLLRAGAASVQVWVAARTPAPDGA